MAKTSNAEKWVVLPVPIRPPFIGELRQGRRILRCCVVSYTTLETAIKEADFEGLNRIINSRGMVARKSGNPQVTKTRVGCHEP